MIIQVKVKANSKRRSELVQLADGTWLAYVKSPPVDGKANAELTEIVAQHFEVPKSQVRIRTGSGSKLKLIQIG